MYTHTCTYTSTGTLHMVRGLHVRLFSITLPCRFLFDASLFSCEHTHAHTQTLMQNTHSTNKTVKLLLHNRTLTQNILKHTKLHLSLVHVCKTHTVQINKQTFITQWYSYTTYF